MNAGRAVDPHHRPPASRPRLSTTAPRSKAILDEGLLCRRLRRRGPAVRDPCIYARIGQRLYLHGSSASRMLRAIAAGAPVCVTVTLLDGLVLARSAFHHSVNYRSVVVSERRRRRRRRERLAALRAIVEHVVPDAGTRRAARALPARADARRGAADLKGVGEGAQRRAEGRRRRSRSRCMGGRRRSQLVAGADHLPNCGGDRHSRACAPLPAATQGRTLMANTIGILLFDDVEELDFTGPWEVFSATAQQLFPDDRVVTIAQELRPIRCAKGLRVLPDFDFTSAPPLDVVLVPGGQGTRREASNPTLIGWLRESASAATGSRACTGALLLHEAGFAKGRRVTTHWAFIETLRSAAT
jgi:nitroimidazol reductase NimA-like FMN-containing flavoprotein (pyridoxamine 5'-phosphate oxidase superfamily)